MNSQIHNKSCSIICTIPRSGTNLLFYFFKYLNLFLHEEDLIDEDIIFKKVINHKITEKYLFPIIGHGYCPGYQQITDNVWHNKWSKIGESDNWFNAIQASYINQQDLYNPLKNTEVRIAYSYRNIYTFLLSTYEHLKNHKNYDLSNKTVGDLAKQITPQYIKGFISFREMKKIYPDNILLVKYEELVEKREKILLEICDFLKIQQSYDNFPQAFQKACEFTDISQMKKLEKSMNCTLAGDQKFYDPSNSHIRAVDRKDELKNLPLDVIREVESMLNEYEIYDFSVPQ